MTLRNLTLSIAAVLAALAVLVPVAADDPPGCCMAAYDKTAEITVGGTVQEIEQPECPRAGLGLHLVIAGADGATYEAHLGPAAFAEEKGFVFAAGDRVEVTGVEGACCGAEALLAREVVRDGEKLTLRDEDGRPEWAGRFAGAGRGPGCGQGKGCCRQAAR